MIFKSTTPRRLFLVSMLAVVGSACQIQVDNGNPTPEPTVKPGESRTSFDLNFVFSIIDRYRSENFFFMAATLDSSPIASLVGVEMAHPEDSDVRLDVTDLFYSELPLRLSTVEEINKRVSMNRSDMDILEDNREEIMYLKANDLSRVAPRDSMRDFYFTFTRADGSQTVRMITLTIQ